MEGGVRRVMLLKKGGEKTKKTHGGFDRFKRVKIRKGNPLNIPYSQRSEGRNVQMHGLRLDGCHRTGGKQMVVRTFRQSNWKEKPLLI